MKYVDRVPDCQLEDELARLRWYLFRMDAKETHSGLSDYEKVVRHHARLAYVRLSFRLHVLWTRAES